MDKFYKIVLFLLGLSVVVHSYYDVPECIDVKEECSTSEFVEIPSNNRSNYYQCNSNGNLTEKSCNEGLWFSKFYRSCVPPTQWKDPCIPIQACLEHYSCSDDHHRQLLWPSWNKSEILECKNETYNGIEHWTFDRKACPKNKWFDFKTQKCISHSEWSNPCANTPNCWKVVCDESQAYQKFPAMDPRELYQCVESYRYENLEPVKYNCLAGSYYIYTIYYTIHKNAQLIMNGKNHVQSLNVLVSLMKIHQ